MLGNPCFDPKTGGYDQNLFPNYFHKIFACTKKMDISRKIKIPNFSDQTIPKLAKTKVRKIPSFVGPYLCALTLQRTFTMSLMLL
jgi:hypothetical protein